MTDTLNSVYATIQDRQKNPKAGSYTNSLFKAGVDEITKKVGEEAIEVIIAAHSQGNERLVSEIADLVYHTLVLMVHAGVAPQDIAAELERRHK
jgi:phosphoribosyl-ATP pyrophosphohydrolase